MNLSEQITIIKNAINRHDVIILFCNCQVEYSGRAKSFLASGDRVIFIKHDYSVLIHRPDGRNPINWMPANSTIKLTPSKSSLLFNIKSLKPLELMNIVINDLYKVSFNHLIDNEQLKLVGTEKDMSDMIYNNPELISKNFIPLNREEQTKYGFVDVFGHDGNGNFIVIECKRYTAGLDSITQLRRYVEKIKKSKGINKVKGIIAAPNITSNALKMLNDWNFEYKIISPPCTLEMDNENQLNLDEF